MTRLLNTLYLLTDGKYISRDHLNFVVKDHGREVMRVPASNLRDIVCLGECSLSTHTIRLCQESGISLSVLSERGRLICRVEGAPDGGVVLRMAQYRLCGDERFKLRLSKALVEAKIHNSRMNILRAARERKEGKRLSDAAQVLGNLLSHIDSAESMDELRGYEGSAARTYFEVFADMIAVEGFAFGGRSKRPPRDAVNALLSFGYMLLASDCASALAGSGLDPRCGFLHELRPGRPALALDFMEPFRAPVVDRMVLALINRRQVLPDGFRKEASGGILMDDETRTALLNEYQNRKHEGISHPLLNEKVQVGLLPLIQARLLARTLRNELDDYPAWKTR